MFGLFKKSLREVVPVRVMGMSRIDHKHHKEIAVRLKSANLKDPEVLSDMLREYFDIVAEFHFIEGKREGQLDIECPLTDEELAASVIFDEDGSPDVSPEAKAKIIDHMAATFAEEKIIFDPEYLENVADGMMTTFVIANPRRKKSQQEIDYINSISGESRAGLASYNEGIENALRDVASKLSDADVTIH